MKTRVTKTPLAGLVVVNIDHFEDARGFFVESWHKKDFADAGLLNAFVQDSHSRSSQRVIRGLHYQDMRAPMAKLVRCTVGRILDVAVDLRTSSPTVGQWFQHRTKCGKQNAIVRTRRLCAWFCNAVRNLRAAIQADRIITGRKPKVGWYGTIPILELTGRSRIPFCQNEIRTLRLSSNI